MIHEDLLNWARWVRARTHQGHCGSIEHRYRLRRLDDAPTGWGDWQITPPKLPTLPPTDIPLALEIERLMRHLPDRHRKALKLTYVYRIPWRLASQRLHLAYACWQEHLEAARQMLDNLRNFRKQRIRRPISVSGFG